MATVLSYLGACLHGVLMLEGSKRFLGLQALALVLPWTLWISLKLSQEELSFGVSLRVLVPHPTLVAPVAMRIASESGVIHSGKQTKTRTSHLSPLTCHLSTPTFHLYVCMYVEAEGLPAVVWCLEV